MSANFIETQLPDSCHQNTSLSHFELWSVKGFKQNRKDKVVRENNSEFFKQTIITIPSSTFKL